MHCGDKFHLHFHIRFSSMCSLLSHWGYVKTGSVSGCCRQAPPTYLKHNRPILLLYGYVNSEYRIYNTEFTMTQNALSIWRFKPPMWTYHAHLVICIHDNAGQSINMVWNSCSLSKQIYFWDVWHLVSQYHTSISHMIKTTTCICISFCWTKVTIC